MYTEFHLLCVEGSWWMKLTEAGCVGFRQQRAGGGFNSTDSCSALGTVPLKQRQLSRLFPLSNHHSICDVKEQRYKYFLKDRIHFSLLWFLSLSLWSEWSVGSSETRQPAICFCSRAFQPSLHLIYHIYTLHVHINHFWSHVIASKSAEIRPENKIFAKWYPNTPPTNNTALLANYLSTAVYYMMGGGTVMTPTGEQE